MDKFLAPLFGGLLIGLSASLMLLLNGRVTGVSGILSGAIINRKKQDTVWRWYFIAGMLLGGFLLAWLKPETFAGALPTANWTLVVAGLLVGFGTSMASGCTSGHGVCGVSRLSPRSLVATLTFIMAGILAVMIFRKLGVFL